ncbi:MAG TPA: hypothetical protein VII45_05820 [Solirubrobacterales bacterium]
MAILTMFEIHGDTDKILADHAETIEPIANPLAEENGGLANYMLKTEDGVLIVNVWENEEGMEKVAAAVRPKAQEAGLPTPQNWRKYEILRHNRTGS